MLGYALDDNRVNCELICDLYHVSAPAIRLAVKMKGVENITMISDCSKFCGMGDGDYIVGDHTIYVRNGLCLLANGTISGSSKCLSDGAKNMFELGYRADIVVFDQNFDIKNVCNKELKMVMFYLNQRLNGGVVIQN